MELVVARTHEEARIPTRSYEHDAGWDLYTSERTLVKANAITDVPCGIRIELPQGYWGMLIGRSSTSHNLGLLVVTAVIDPHYTGQMFAQVVNMTDKSVVVEVGQRVAQLVLVPVTNMRTHQVRILEEAEFDNFLNTHWARDTRRNNNGFGSSGK